MLSPGPWENALTFTGIADEAQLAILTKILDDYCTALGIANGDPAREDLGRRIMALFNSGYSFEQIEQSLRDAPEDPARIGCRLHSEPDAA
jgi:hypothetical protein